MTHHASSRRDTAMTARANALTAGAIAPRTDGPGSPVPASQLRGFTIGLRRLGYDIDLLLQRANVANTDLDDPEALVPCSAGATLLRGAAAQHRHRDLGAYLGSVTPIGAFPLLDYLVVTADTVRGALNQLVRYLQITGAPFTCRVVDDGDIARFVIEPGDDPFIALYETSLTIHHLREETGGRLRPNIVSLIPTPDDAEALSRLLSCHVRAPATWTGIEFSHAMLDLPLRRRDAILRGVLEGHASALTTRAPSLVDDSLDTSLRAFITARLATGVPTISATARELAMAPRTLQRRLAAIGMSYDGLVDRVRRESAERLLTDASLSIGEIGYVLGFSEPSAFHRAFKRWHGCTPQTYRHHLKSQRP